MKRFALLCLSLMLLATGAFAQDVSPGKEEVLAPKQNYSPYVDQHFPNRVFWVMRISTRLTPMMPA